MLSKTFLRTQRALFQRSSFRHTSFEYQALFDMGPDTETEYTKLTSDYVSTVEVGGQEFLQVEAEGIQLLTETAIRDVSHLLRSSHLQSLSNILKDEEATDNDRFVAMELLKNANIAANMVLPGCQDTGTAIIMGKKGQNVLTSHASYEEMNNAAHQGKMADEVAISKGVYEAYQNNNLRFSQVAPLTMFEEKNTGTNLPCQIELFATGGSEYSFQFMTKGGGSANKTFLFQETKAVLNDQALMEFLEAKIKTIGTSACPPYHLAIVIGGLSAELNLKTVKLASSKYYDTLPTTGNDLGRAFRDVEFEERVNRLCQQMGIGAQFGGKYFVHDVRVIRLPRHGASCPIGIGVSCSADRQAKAKITKDGIFLETLERDPSKFLPEVTEETLSSSSTSTTPIVNIDLNQPMSDILSTLTQHPIRTRVNLSGDIVVARDIAHAKLLERLQNGEGLPDYIKDHIIYYAGPAKTPEGYASGSFGPTTAGRMDSYVPLFMKEGGSMITLAKGNRSRQVTKACKQYGGFYLGSIGGPAAILAENCIKKVEVLEYPELGMEAIWKIRVENFPAFIVVDDKGNDFFSEWLG